MKKYKIMIDPGHGGKDPGCVHKNLQEKDITLATSLLVGGFLIQKSMKLGLNVDCIYTRSSDTYVTLAARAGMANANKADVFISIHVNAEPNKKARGKEVIVHPRRSSQTDKLAAIFRHIFGKEENFRGVLGRDFYVLRATFMPAVLIEIGFIHDENIDWTKPTVLANIANKIAEGIIIYLEGGINERKG